MVGHGHLKKVAMMSKPYKEMTAVELASEIGKVSTILRTHKDSRTQNQYKKYLARLKERYYEVIHNNTK